MKSVRVMVDGTWGPVYLSRRVSPPFVARSFEVVVSKNGGRTWEETQAIGYPGNPKLVIDQGGQIYEPAHQSAKFPPRCWRYPWGPVHVPRGNPWNMKFHSSQSVIGQLDNDQGLRG